jgi:carbonic anhydrase
MKITQIGLYLITLAACIPDSNKKLRLADRQLMPLVETVLTEEEQKRLTPDMIIDSLKAGNKRFVNGSLTLRDHSAQVRHAVLGQYPKAVVLACIDSRVTVEDIFDKGIGDLFIAKVAGNVVNEDILGSIEFGCKVAGAKVVIVLGHEYCGAIKSAIDEVKLGNVTNLLAKIKPAIDSVLVVDKNRSGKNKDFVHSVCLQNVHLAIRTIREKSQILSEMEEKGEIKIVGADYDMETGVVTFLE